MILLRAFSTYELNPLLFTSVMLQVEGGLIVIFDSFQETGFSYIGIVRHKRQEHIANKEKTYKRRG